ncbi:MAG: hypothetical protein AB1Z23_04945 [Eubacteriales bacterium]
MSYKFVQISDIAFNHSLSSDIEINKYIENARREAFEKVIEFCIQEKATALLICGNLYDQEHISFENAKIIKKGFSRLKSKNIAIVYAHGNLDKGVFLDSIEDEVLEIKKRYTKHIYSLPFDLDTVRFLGIGCSKRLVFQDEYLEEEKTSTPTIGIMYIDHDIYQTQTIELLQRRMEKSNVDYWAVGGSEHFIDKTPTSNYCYSGHLCPKREAASGCVLVTITNKMKVTTKTIDICNLSYQKISIDDPNRSRDIYQLMERCADLIEKSKIPDHDMIIDLIISGPCSCYNQLVNHRKALQDELSKITKTAIYMNISELTKEIKTTKEMEEEIQVSQLLDKYYQLYDDEELYNKTVSRLKAKRVFYNENLADVDKRKILEGVDSIILESSIKEDGHDY